MLRTNAIAIVLWGLASVAPAGAADGSPPPPTTSTAPPEYEGGYAPDAADFRIVQVVKPSCTVDRVTVRIAYHGDTTEIGLVLKGDGRVEAARERVEPGRTVTLTGQPVAFGTSREYYVNTSFLDDHSGVTTLREVTVERPAAATCGSAPQLPVTGPGSVVVLVGAGLAFLTLGVVLLAYRRRPVPSR